MTTSAEATPSWRPTPLLVGVTGVGAILACVAVPAHRPDLLVLAVPLLTWALLAAASRPPHPPTIRTLAAPAVVTEDEPVTLTVQVVDTPGVDAVGLRRSGTTSLVAEWPGPSRHVDGADPLVDLVLHPRAWGVHAPGTVEVALGDTWGGHRARATLQPAEPITVLPRARPLAAVPDRLDPSHFLGRHVSRRLGDGAEFAEIRPYRPGDRVRRIHWPTTARRGELHVRTHTAEQDGAVVLLVDALGDLPADGPGQAGSLEAAGRAAAVLATHFTRRGDRVGLRVAGQDGITVPASTGTRHLRRLLGALAQVELSVDRTPEPPPIRLVVPPGTLLVAATPLTSRRLVDALVAAARSGTTVGVVHVMPPLPTEGRAHDVLAGRILRLEAATTADRLQALGIPVVAWADSAGVEGLLHALDRRRRAVRR